MNILITGAQFNNKGAQSMLFTVVNEIRNRYPDADFYYLPLDYFKEGCFQNVRDYRFHFVIDDKAGRDFPAKFGALNHLARRVNIQRILHRANKYGQVLLLSSLWDRLDVLIDISGYSLTSRFGVSSINRVLRMLKTAKAYGLKTIMLPQSYGPFDFPDHICREIGKVLSKTDLLFAREEDGIEQLRDRCGVTNTVLSPDIVIQTGELDWKNIFVRRPKLTYPVLETGSNVGIIPNGETLRHGNREAVLAVYREILKMLRSNGKEVYIFRHSDDLELCESIYEMVREDHHCHLIRDEIDCLSYSAFIRQFEFIVASRFHSVVHAYREGIPALVLGWAVKYQSLTALLGQEAYAFDLTSENGNRAGMIYRGLDRLMDRAGRESELIKYRRAEIQKNNCFDMCRNVLDTL